MMTSIVTSASEDGKCSAGSRCMDYTHSVNFVYLPHLLPPLLRYG
jgi:hypothetical protein